MHKEKRKREDHHCEKGSPLARRRKMLEKTGREIEGNVAGPCHAIACGKPKGGRPLGKTYDKQRGSCLVKRCMAHGSAVTSS
eukprot:12275757-Heterocapsa_arctica.AAC.1